jgi:S-adenosylmethionine uptake transporter
MLSDNMKGALIMALSMALFTLNDVFMKLLSGQVSLYQILTLRNGAVTFVFLCLAWRAGAFRVGLSSRDLMLSILRGGAEVVTAYFFLNALFNMPLANVTAILQVAPLMVMLAAALVLGEQIGWRRGLAASIGFCGVLLIVRPGPEGFNSYALYALIAVLSLTVRDIATRKLSKDAPTLLVTAITSGMILIVFGGMSVVEGWVPLESRSGGLILGAAVMVLGAYLASVQAMRVGEVSFVSPFRYTSLLWGLMLGFVVFGDWPKPLTLIGAAIVVGSGLYSFYREMLAKRRAQVSTMR